MGNNFALRFSYVFFQMFLKNYNFDWILGEPSKNLPQALFISFRIIKDFQ